MRLRNRVLPQAGTEANRDGESRTSPFGLGCPSYSGGGDVSQLAAQSQTVAAQQENSSSCSSPKSLFSSLPSSPPSYFLRSSRSSPTLSLKSVDVVAEATLANNPSPTTASATTRKKWSQEMNEFIWRTYLIITNLETDTNTYLASLHQQFTDKFPNMKVSRQRIGDQRRAIVNKKLLPSNILDKIRLEVRNSLETERSNIQIHDQTQEYIPPQIHTQLQSQSQPRRRMKWSNSLNETLMLCYFRTTKLETDMTAWRKKLKDNFIEYYPHLSHLSEQRISDQKRVIVNNNMISETQIQLLKTTIENELIESDTFRLHDHQATNLMNDNSQQFTTINTLNSNIENMEVSQSHQTELEAEIDLINNINLEQITQHTDNERNPEIDNIFIETLQYYRDTQPTDRSYIPKQKSSTKLANIIFYIDNTILREHLSKDMEFNQLQTLIYCAAWTAAKVNGSKISLAPVENGNRHKTNYIPKWQKRLERKIEVLRAKIGRLTHFIQGHRSRKLTKEVDLILQHHRIHTSHEEPNTQLTHFLDTLKQKLTVVTSRLNRYKKCTLRKTQNYQFKHNEKLFYRTLKISTTNQTTSNSTTHPSTPTTEQLQQFWAGIWENPVGHNTEAEWIGEEEAKHTNTNQMEFDHVEVQTFHEVLKRLHNWKAPGSDHIHNFWYKKFTHIHSHVFNHINNFIKHPSTIPPYITEGITYMLPKDSNDTSNPAKYRPITCLQTIYKIMTACITHIIYKHLEAQNILTEEQKGCRKFSQGCKEQLTIDSIILKQVQRKKTDLYTMYIDYKKAYDSVPHSWLLQVLHIYKIHPQIISCLSSIIQKWNTRLHLNTPTGIVETELIKIQRGIFQGDSLSPLWFCLALNPLSNKLNALKPGYQLQYEDTAAETDITHQNCKINHLLYMDDIKLYASSSDDLSELANVTEQFSNDIAMEFGIDKCKINSIRAGKTYTHSYQLQTGDTIDSLDENGTYKYLGYIQAKQILDKQIKSTLTKQFTHRLKTIFNTQIYARNTIKAINTYAIPILTYSFGIIKWNKTDLKSLQRTINTTLTKHRRHHPRSCVQRLTLPRTEGGRGIIDITNLHNKQITILRTYFNAKASNSTLHKAIVFNDKKLSPLNLADKMPQPNEKQTDRHVKIAEWTQKSLHGRHRHDHNQANVDKVASNEWLRRGELFPETEGFMIAIQDQVIETRNYQKHIMKVTLPTDICRRCNSSSETIQHITGACKAIVQTDYKHRHDQIANIIHQKLAIKYKLITTPPVPYYKYQPETVLENTTHKLYYDRAILTDKTTHYNRPDITILDKINRTAQIIDIAVPNTHNLQNTIAEKLSKYTDLKIEISRMWHLNNVTIIPIVLSTTGVIPKQLHQSIKTLDLPPYTYQSIQKAAILNTCRIVRKFLQNENETTITPSHTRPTNTIRTQPQEQTQTLQNSNIDSFHHSS